MQTKYLINRKKLEFEHLYESNLKISERIYSQ